VNESLEFTIKKFKTIFFSLILLEVICANIHWRAAAIIKTEKEMLHLDVLNKHFSRTTGSLGLSTSPKTNETRRRRHGKAAEASRVGVVVSPPAAPRPRGEA